MNEQEEKGSSLGAREDVLKRVPPVNYENRTVAYFDFLGWKAHVVSAGTDPGRLGILDYLLKSMTVSDAPGDYRSIGGQRKTTFSDNVVVSVPFSPRELLGVVVSLAKTQLSFSIIGFSIRGAITIGKIRHTESTVFGPALNEAYRLESEEAVYPRILLDSSCYWLHALRHPLIVREGTSTFVDPFKPEAIEYLSRDGADFADALKRSGQLAELERKMGFELPSSNLRQMNGVSTLRMLMDMWREELELPMPQRAWENIAWLYDRAAIALSLTCRAENLNRRLPDAI